MVQEPQEEKKEFLKREEIRTMAKDVARLREIESQEEREKISSLGAEGKTKNTVTDQKESKEEKPEEVKKEISFGLMPKPPLLKTSPRKKYLIRGGIIFVVVLILGFFLWYLATKGSPQEELLPPEELPVQQNPPPEEILKPEIIIPASFIQTSGTTTKEILKTDNIPEALNQSLKEIIPLGVFNRILIKNTDQNKLISLEDLSASFQVEIPEEFLSKLESDFTLAIFSQKQGNRIAIITKVKDKEGLTDIFKNWEKNISEKGLFLSGNKIQTDSLSFKTAYVQKTGLRYLTISKDDFGICYAWFGNYFVLTSSFDSIKNIIQQLNI